MDELAKLFEKGMAMKDSSSPSPVRPTGGPGRSPSSSSPPPPARFSPPPAPVVAPAGALPMPVQRVKALPAGDHAGKKRKREPTPYPSSRSSTPASSSSASSAKEPAKKKAKVEGKGRVAVKNPLSKAEYLKKVRERANQAGYDGRAVEFSDKPSKKFMIYDDKGKKHYFGANSYGDFIIWSATDSKKAEQKRKAYHSRASKAKGDWKNDKFSPNNLALKILW